MKSGVTIGELARQLQCEPATIRYYEQEGLLPAPARSSGNYRLYGAVHQERLAFIRRCRSLDMTLEEIRTLLRLHDTPAGNCAPVSSVLDEHIRHVAGRINELRALQRQLTQLRDSCAHETRDSCGILWALAHDNEAGTKAMRAGVHTHRRGR